MCGASLPYQHVVSSFLRATAAECTGDSFCFLRCGGRAGQRRDWPTVNIKSAHAHQQLEGFCTLLEFRHAQPVTARSAVSPAHWGRPSTIFPCRLVPISMLQRVRQLAIVQRRLVPDGQAVCRAVEGLLPRSTIAAGRAAAGSQDTVTLPAGSAACASRCHSTALCGASLPCAPGNRQQGLAQTASGPRARSCSDPAQLASAFQHCSLHSSPAGSAAGASEPGSGGDGQAPAAAEQQAPKLQRLPWTPTRLLDKRKTLPKRMGHMLQVLPSCCGPLCANVLHQRRSGLLLNAPLHNQVLEDERVAEALRERSIPAFGPGDVLEVKLVRCPWAMVCRTLRMLLPCSSRPQHL